MKPFAPIILATMILGWPAIGFAGPCDAYFTFDRTLADASGNGYHGEMFAKDRIMSPSFTEGKFGQALSLDGTSGMRALLDLHYDICPQLTMTAWIYVSRDVPPDTMHVLSTGGGSGLGLRTSDTYLVLAGTENGIGKPSAIRKGSWTFVAGVYDWEKNSYQLHWNARHTEPQTLSQYRYEPKPALWVGTVSDEWGIYASGVAIDDLRIIGRVLSDDEIAALRTRPPATGEPADVLQEQNNQPAASGSDSAAGRSAAGGSSTSSSGESTTGGDPIADLRKRNSDKSIDVDHDSPPDLMSRESTTGGDPIAELRERNSDTRIDLDYDSPPDLLNRESTTGDGTDSGLVENELTAPPQAASSGSGPTIREILEGYVYNRNPTGDVRQCTSFSEVVADLATAARDAIVEVAVRGGCGLIQEYVSQSQVAQHMSNAGENLSDSELNSAAFHDKLINEVYNGCVIGTSAVAQIPDTVLGYWNDTVAAGGWATIGPRQLIVEKTISGDLRAPGDRKFVTSLPLMGTDSVTVSIDELAGRARTHVRVCTVDLHNHYTQHSVSTFNETPEERQNPNQKMFKDLNGINWHFLIVKLDAEGSSNRHFKYDLRVYKN